MITPGQALCYHRQAQGAMGVEALSGPSLYQHPEFHSKVKGILWSQFIKKD
jgi:hypothetical protein